ncbi:hypothetical protein EXS74_02905 [Candidatus Woesearchaeota archaeon]|nr:hypothetical protein [Candidatus Woesearchaeota archaeon]
MKKIISLLFVLLLLPIASAASLYPDSYGYYGQNQYYYTVFDGEGESAVLARIELQNVENLTEFSFKIPGENISLINIVQEYYDYTEECSNWEEVSCSTTDDVETCNKECTDYIRYPVYPPSYAQVSYTLGESEGMTSVSFEIPEQDQDNIYILAYYKTNSYVSESAGVYEYHFQTIQDEYDTNYVRVSLDVAEDLYLEGVSSAIDYQKEVFATSESADFARVASSLSYIDTGYTETATSLDPYESFSVEGKYANSWWNIHWWEVVIGVLVGIAILGAIIYGIRKITKKNKKLGLPLLLGVASGILLFGVWFACSYLLQNSYYLGFYNDTVMLFIILLTIVMSIFLLAVPAVWVGYTEGVKSGMICFIATVLTLFILCVIAISWLSISSVTTSPEPIFY